MKKLLLIACSSAFMIACSTGSETKPETTADMTAGENSLEVKEERNKQIALASMQSINNRNVDSVLAHAEANAVDYNTGEMPPVKGLDSIKAGMKMWLDAFPDYKGTDFMPVADGDYVMVYATWTGTWKNDFMGMKASGKSFKVNDVDIFKFNNDGKIVEHRAVQSMNEFARQVGMKMP